MSMIRAIRCIVGPVSLAIDLATIVGLHRADAMKLAPAGSPLAGTILEHADEIPVYFLSDLLGIDTDRSPTGHIVVANASGEQIGLLVDRVAHLGSIPAENFFGLSPLLGDPRGLCFSGVLKAEHQLLPLLAPERFGSHASAAHVRPSISPGFPAGTDSTGNVVTDRLVLFSAGRDATDPRAIRFGIGMHQVAEVTQAPPVTPIPGAPPFIRGVTLWRDVVIPVLDLSAKVGLESAGEVDDRMVVLRGPTRIGPVAIMTRETRVLRLPVPNEPSTRPLAIDSTLLKGQIELRRETVLLPDLAAMLRA